MKRIYKVKTYRCDPDKNHWCRKTYCYRKWQNNNCCKRTFEKEYKMDIFKRIKEKVIYKC